MSRRFILAMLLLGVCLASTAEAQLFRRGFAQRPDQGYYPQQLYRQQTEQPYCNQREASQEPRSESRLFVLPNGQYVVQRNGQFYYARPNELQSRQLRQRQLQQQQQQQQFRQMQTERNAYARQMYGQQPQQAVQVTPTNRRSELIARQPNVNASNSATIMQMRPIQLPPSSATIIPDGPIIEGPTIVGPVVAEPTPIILPGQQNAIRQVDGTLPVGEIQPTADIPTATEGDAKTENKNYSVLEKGGGA